MYILHDTTVFMIVVLFITSTSSLYINVEHYVYVYRLLFCPDNEVYAWGNNAMGQCGQGHAQSPITRPRKVIGVEGVSIQQISAGTSHSIAWTALPLDR